MPMNWLRDLRGKPGNQTEVRACTPAAAPAGPAAPQPDDPPAVWVEAVCNATDKAVATVWAAQVEGEECLAEIAMRCRYAEIRLAAAQRIADVAVLKRVAEASRDKDKHVYRHCTDALRAHRQGGERARRAPELEAALRALLDATPLAISHLLQIEKDIAVLGADGSELARCADLLAQAHARVLEETRDQIALRSALSAAEALRSEIAAAALPPGTELEAWRARGADLAQRAASGPAWLLQLPAARTLTATLQDIESRLAALALHIARAAAEEAQRAEEIAQLARPESVAPPGVVPVVAKEARPSRKPVDQALVQRLVDEFEKHLEEGRLAEADAAAIRIDRALGGAASAGQVARRLQRARSQQTRLHGWARWGTDQAREQLIGAAEALLRGEPDIAERARAVPLLRTEWKSLDAHGAAAKTLWTRFDTALERAYKPVAEQRAAEAARHEAARAFKRSLCDAWEAWLGQQSASVPDTAALGAKRDEMIAQWRAAVNAGYRDERRLRKRLDALLARIDAQLEEVRAMEIARREQLIVSAETSRDTPDTGQAVNAAKSLQRRWKDDANAVRLRHGEDRKLWERFRGACDAMFARRDAEQAGQATQRVQRAEARKAVLDEFDGGISAGIAAADAGLLKKTLAQFHVAWTAQQREAGDRSGEPDHRARDLVRRAEQKIEALQREKEAARFALMAQKAALARGAGEAEGAEPASSDTLATLARGHAARDELLLELEVALELPTPDSHAEARRARMLMRLQKHFRGDAAPVKDPEDLVAQWYATPATPDAGQDARLACVVRRLLERGGKRAKR